MIKKNIFIGVPESIILILILVIALVMRTWQLSTIPPHLTADEAALGYNAYSVLKTGRDEYGQFLPVIFRSFGDYKPGLYIYLTVPFISLLGLNEFSVRLPGALAGVMSVYLIYLIVKKFTSYRLQVISSKNGGSDNPQPLILPAGRQAVTRNSLTPLLSAFLLAINPWHLFYSRGAWEITLALTLSLSGIYFFLRSLKNQKFLFLSAFLFAMTLWTYQGAKLSSAIIVLLLGFIYIKQLLRFSPKILIGSALLGAIISIPIVLSLFMGQTGRLEVFSIFSYPRPKAYTQMLLSQAGESFKSMSYYLFHSEILNFFRGISGRWFNHFSTRFLFFAGDYQNPGRSVPNNGMLAMGDIFLIISGLVYLIRKGNKESLFIFLWLILSPLPSALTRDQVQPVRAFQMVIPLVIISAFGINYLLDLAKRGKLFFVGVSAISIIYGLSYVYFLDAYFIHFPIHNAPNWSYGYKQAVTALQPYRQENLPILFQQSYEQPYIYFLFYEKYDPSFLQQEKQLRSEVGIDVSLVDSLGNITFKPMNWPMTTPKPGTIVVVNAITAPGDLIGDEYTILKEIPYPNKTMIAFNILQVKYP